ncbi:hypothetical protein AB205_0113710 [Aquarana catesbeiana]|uniref:Uncharacterized protein n=1 Tax=Aquarana catesbeiana TaxID=8400 RepID=A0A2G9RAS4_AQUCT|nr:hypothetical protein AB205_0113710 [Aquarana catesbeiana]
MNPIMIKWTAERKDLPLLLLPSDSLCYNKKRSIISFLQLRRAFKNISAKTKCLLHMMPLIYPTAQCRLLGKAMGQSHEKVVFRGHSANKGCPEHISLPSVLF